MSYFLKVRKIPNNFKCIYKLNFPNGKIYIGRTINLKRRMLEHNNINKAKAPCDFAIRKYGKIKEVEILEDNFKNDEELYEREKFWINYYNATNRKIGYNISKGGKDWGWSGVDSIHSNWTKEEIEDIRKRKANKERKRDVYKDYENKNFSTFSSIWEGRSYRDILSELIDIKTDYSIYGGENRKNNKLTDSDVKRMKIMYMNGISVPEIIKEFSFCSKTTIKSALREETWKHVKVEGYKWDNGYIKQKITEKIVKEIKIKYRNGATKEEILKDYIHYGTKRELTDILEEKTYSHIKVENYPKRMRRSKLSKEEKEKIYNKYIKGKQITRKTVKESGIPYSSLYKIKYLFESPQ